MGIKRDGSILNTLLVALIEPNTGHLLLPYINATLGALLLVLLATYLKGYGRCDCGQAACILKG